MARAGEKIYNPVQEDSIEFRQADRDTGGQLMSGEMVVLTRGANQLHVHPLQEEHFEVLSGTFGVQIGDEQRSLGEGEEATVPPGTPPPSKTSVMARALAVATPLLVASLFLLGMMQRRKR